LNVQCPEADKGAEAIAALARAGVGVAAFALGQPTLDEVFLALTDRPAQQKIQTEETAA
jgi:ABC-2 type transport system ATP-binding protein